MEIEKQNFDVEVREVLVRAHELIALPEHWTKGTYARNSSGMSVFPKAADAVCFCATGALLRVLPSTDYSSSILELARSVLCDAAGVDNVVAFNDNARQIHEVVVAAFVKAIESLPVDGADEKIDCAEQSILV